MSELFRVNCLPSWDDPEASLWPYPSSVYVIAVHWGTSQLMEDTGTHSPGMFSSSSAVLHRTGAGC